MTTTLICSAMVGAAVGYPLLKRGTQLDGTWQEKAQRLGERVCRPLMLGVLALPFQIYPLPYAMVVAVTAVLGAISLPLALLSWLLAASMTWLGLLVVVLTVLATIRRKKGQGFQQFPLRQAAVYAAAWIILTEVALASASEGLFPVGWPEICAWIGGERALPALVTALKDTDPMVYEVAKKELAAIGKPAVPWLVPLRHDLDERVRRDAAALLIKNGEVSKLTDQKGPGIPPLVSALDDEDKEVRVLARKAIIGMNESALPDLVSVLPRRDLTKGACEAIFSSLRGMNPEIVVPTLLGTFQGRGNVTRFYLPTELALFGQPAVLPLNKALQHSDPWVRYWAREALVKIGQQTLQPQTVIQSLLQTLQKAEGEARKEAAFALGELQVDEAIPALINALTDPEVVNAAAWALGNIPDKRAVPALHRALRRWPSPEIVIALGKIHDPSVIPPLTEALKSQDPEFRRTASQVLSEHLYLWGGKKSSVPALIAQLNSSSDEEVLKVAEELGNVGDRTVAPALEQADKQYHARHPGLSGQPHCKICRALREVRSR